MPHLEITLKNKTFYKLKKYAEKTGKPVSESIDELIQNALHGEPKKISTKKKWPRSKDPLFNIEPFDTDVPTDFSVNHDKYLYSPDEE